MSHTSENTDRIKTVVIRTLQEDTTPYAEIKKVRVTTYYHVTYLYRVKQQQVKVNYLET